MDSLAIKRRFKINMETGERIPEGWELFKNGVLIGNFRKWSEADKARTRLHQERQRQLLAGERVEPLTHAELAQSLKLSGSGREQKLG